MKTANSKEKLAKVLYIHNSRECIQVLMVSHNHNTLMFVYSETAQKTRPLFAECVCKQEKYRYKPQYTPMYMAGEFSWTDHRLYNTSTATPRYRLETNQALMQMHEHMS